MGRPNNADPGQHLPAAVNGMGRVKPRGYPLRRWLRLDQRTAVRRRVLARQEQEPQPEVVADGFEDARRRYAAWGCSAPPPTERKDNAFD